MARRFFSGLGTSYLALIINALMLIILMPFFLHHLGEEMTGIYIMIAGLSNVLNFGVGWLSDASSLTISSRTHQHRPSYLIKPIYRIQQLVFLGYGALICGLFIAAAIVLPYLWQPSHAEYMQQVQWSLTLFGIHYLIFLLHNGDLAFLTSQLRLDFANGCRAVYNIIFCSLTIAFLYLQPSIYIVFIAQLTTTLIIGAVSQIYLRKYHLHWFQFTQPRRILWRSVLMKIGGPLAGISLLWAVMMYADTALIGFLLGPAAAAHFFAGTKIADTLALLLIRISETALPYFARLKNLSAQDSRQFFYLQLQRVLLFLTIIAAAGYGLFGEAVMQLWLGDKAPILPPLLFWLAGLSIIFRTLVKHEYNMIIAMQQIQKALPVSVWEAVIRVAAIIICIQLFGLIGPALSLVLVYGLGFYWLIKCRAMQIIGANTPQNLLSIINPVILSAFCLAAWWLLQRVIWPSGYETVYGTLTAAGMLGMMAIGIPLLLIKRLPLFEHKQLFQLFESLSK